MAIKTTYDFNGIEVKDAIIKIERIFGSRAEGWNSLINVYVIRQEPTTVTNEDGTTEEKLIDVYKKIDEFNFSVPFKEEERGYKTLYTALIEKYGGERV